MKKEYISPVAEQVPLMMDRSLCDISTMRYVLITEVEQGNYNPTLYDGDSD